MSITLNTDAYRKLLEEDREWLLKQPRSLERDHIETLICYEIAHADRTVKESHEVSRDA